MRRLNLSYSVRGTCQNDQIKIKPRVAAAPSLLARFYHPLTDSWPYYSHVVLGNRYAHRKAWNGPYPVKGRQFMTLASGGATRASWLLPAGPAPGRRIEFLAFTPLRTHEERPAYLAGRPFRSQSLASVRRGIEREGHGSGEDLLVDDEGHRGDVEHDERREGSPHHPL